jgi:hypothetical protein
MIFEFLHNDSPCTAFIPDKNSPSSGCLTVYILDNNMELGYELIFLQEDEGKWDTLSTMKNNYPSTFGNICNQRRERLQGYPF